MLYAVEQIKEDYDYEDAKEIVNNGCQSGVCFKHIYYGDTIAFFDRYEDEIIEFIIDNVGNDVLLDLFTDANYDLNGYKNNVTWAFIELVACEIVDEYESTTCEELSDSDLLQYTMFGINPERSMTDSRYAQV